MSLVRIRLPSTRSHLGVAALLVVIVSISLASTGAAALSPNHSIFIYKPGTATTGTLKNAILTKKRTFALSGVTHAAASRSSLALYTKGTGRLRTGRFRDGIYTPVATTTIRTGFTHVAAGCDTILFYNTLTGRTLVGSLTGGRFRNASSFLLEPGWQHVVASCDTAAFLKNESSYGLILTGVVSGGDFSQVGTGSSSQVRLAAMSSTSWIVLNPSGGGDWGTASAGYTGYVDSDCCFTTVWDDLVGSANSLLFYRAGGDDCTATLKGGSYTYGECRPLQGPGWTILAAGR